MQITTKFTPGPWSAGKTTVFGPDDQDGHVTHIASVAGHNDHASDNAALIAAAPELYEAHDSLADFCNEMFLKPAENPELIEALRVLAKARGEA